MFDSSHWYLPDGTPFYETKDAKGQLRGVTLRDARKVNAVPSVTTVLGMIAKPQLERWKVQQAILAALTLPRNEQEAEDDYISRILTDSQAQAKAAAEEGTRIHDAIESAFTHGAYPKNYRLHVEAVLAKIGELFPKVTDWKAEASFAHADGFGGKVDLHSQSTGIVVDYKGKDGDFSDGKKLAWDQHYQLGGYREGLMLPKGAPAANIFVSRTHPGKVAAHVWTPSEVDAGARVFRYALGLWQEVKGYAPLLRAA